MGIDGNINIVQTLFLISNSFNGFGFGVFLFAFGVGQGVLRGVTGGYIACAAVGAAVVALALLGYCGAVTLNKRMLYIYSLVTIGGAAFEVVHLAILGINSLDNSHRFEDIRLQAFYVTMICIIVVSMVSVLLACALAVRGRAHGHGNKGWQ